MHTVDDERCKADDVRQTVTSEAREMDRRTSEAIPDGMEAGGRLVCKRMEVSDVCDHASMYIK